MKHKLGILTALILSLVIAGSAFASPQTPTAKKSSSVTNKKTNKLVATKKPKKHHKKSKRTKKMSSKMKSTIDTPNPK
ncbi:MAG: hypothetical protein H0X72_14520 [Acidobacteria bacterium]|nr:hypothetical protein [Acidobacteriota bacterium]